MKVKHSQQLLPEETAIVGILRGLKVSVRKYFTLHKIMLLGYKKEMTKIYTQGKNNERIVST